MSVVQCAVTTVLVAVISMPLLTELVSSENGFCYKHGAPNGAVPRPAPHSTENNEKLTSEFASSPQN